MNVSMTRILVLLLTLFCGGRMLNVAASDSMRCDGRIIQDGALEVEVLGACGEPAYRDPERRRSATRNVIVTDSEEWYYNFGSSQLLRVVRMRNGKVVNIDSDGYGFDRPPTPPCNPLDIVQGLSKFRLVLNCGEPATQKSVSVLVPLHPRSGYGSYGGGTSFVTPVQRDEWVYNFGSSYLLRIVTLENGRVTDVQNGNRGFD